MRQRARRFTSGPSSRATRLRTRSCCSSVVHCHGRSQCGVAVGEANEVGIIHEAIGVGVAKATLVADRVLKGVGHEAGDCGALVRGSGGGRQEPGRMPGATRRPEMIGRAGKALGVVGRVAKGVRERAKQGRNAGNTVRRACQRLFVCRYSPDRRPRRLGVWLPEGRS